MLVKMRRLLPWLTLASLFGILPVAHSAKVKNCVTQFVAYDFNNKTTYATFPYGEVGDVLWNPAEGYLDLHSFRGVNLDLIANFCDDSIKSVRFMVKDPNTDTLIYSSVDSNAPFAIGGSGTNSTPPVFLTKQGNYVVSAYGYGKANAQKAPISLMTLALEILPRVRVSSISFVDTNTGISLASTSDPFNPLTLDLNKLPARANISIRVDQTVGDVQSVEFKLIGTDLTANSTNYTFLDNQSPFAAGGNSPNGSYNPVNLFSKPGTYKLVTTSYASTQQKAEGGSSTFNIAIQGFRFDGLFPFVLVDAATNTDVEKLFTVDTLILVDLSPYSPNKTLTIRPQLVGSGGSISYELHKYQKVNISSIMYPYLSLENPVPVFRSVQNRLPYSVAGVSSTSGFSEPLSALMHSGVYRLKATAFADPNKQTPSDFALVEFAVLPPFSVTGLTVMDATTRKPIQDVPLYVGDNPFADYDSFSIDLTNYTANTTFAINANTRGVVGSVLFRLSRLVDTTFVNVQTIVDNDAPFKLGGPYLSVPGRYRLEVMGFGKANQQGDTQLPLSIYFSVLPRVFANHLNLVDAATRQVLSKIISVVDLSLYPANKTFSITASTSALVASMRYDLYRRGSAGGETLLFSRVVNGAPFPLSGVVSSNGSKAYAPVQLFTKHGQYQLRATPFSLSNQGGEKGPVLKQNFVVLPQFGIDRYTWIDVPSSKQIATGANNVLYLSQHPSGASFDIRAVTHGSIGSVALDLFRYNDDNKKYSLVMSIVDNTGLFTLGNSVTGNYKAVPSLATPGRYLLQGTPYSVANKSGTQGVTSTYEFRVVARPGSCSTFCGQTDVAISGSASCSCNSTCVIDGNCCIDYCDNCAKMSFSVCK